MQDADRQYFEAMERLFAYPEMKILLDDVHGWKDAIASQWRSLRPDQLAYEQGRFAGLEQVTEHMTMCQNLHDAALAADAAAAGLEDDQNV